MEERSFTLVKEVLTDDGLIRIVNPSMNMSPLSIDPSLPTKTEVIPSINQNTYANRDEYLTKFAPPKYNAFALLSKEPSLALNIGTGHSEKRKNTMDMNFPLDIIRFYRIFDEEQSNAKP